MRILRVLPLFMVLLFGCLPHQTFAVGTDVAGFVDMRQLYLAHPLMRQFDLQTRRFRDTASAFVADPEKSRDEYQRQITVLQTREKELDRAFGETLKVADPQRKKAESDRIWLEKNDLKTRIANLQQAIDATKVYGNYLLGAATGVESIIPLVRKVTQDIDLVIRQLSARNGNMPILDLANVFPGGNPPVCDRAVLFNNVHFSLWNSNPDPNQVSAWLTQLRLSMRDRWPERFQTPFYHGFKDLREEAVRLLTGSSR